MLHLILYVFAFVLTLTGAFYNPPRCNIAWVGVACFILTFLI